MLEKPDREKMREIATASLCPAADDLDEWQLNENDPHIVNHLLFRGGSCLSYERFVFEEDAKHIVAFRPSVALQLLDQIDELEARLVTEREAGFMLAVKMLNSDPKVDGRRLEQLADFWAEWLLEQKPKTGQTVCAHGNPEPMPEEFEKVFKENWKDILA